MTILLWCIAVIVVMVIAIVVTVGVIAYYSVIYEEEVNDYED